MIEEKIKSRQELRTVIDAEKRSGRKVVFTNGCFDLVHVGHVKYLESARALGDRLVVAVNSDVSVKKIKGEKRPITDEYSRARVIAALGSVDYVTLFDEDTPLETIKALQPDVLVKGADWADKTIVGSDIVLANGGTVKTIKFLDGYSTSLIIEKIKKL